MTQSPDDQLAVVLGQRQLIAVCCMFLVVLGLVATMAYVTGRSITAAQMKSLEKADTPAIVVDPGKAPNTAVPAPMEAKAQPLESATPARQPIQTSSPLASGETEPLSGQSFWQVGQVERGMAPIFIEYFTRQGFRVRTAGGQSDRIRILVGPLTDQADTDKEKRALDALGFPAFFKKY